MKRAQLFTLAGLMMATSGFATATSINFQGLDANRSALVWMNSTYLSGDLMLNGQTATSATTVTEQIGLGVLNLTFDGSLQLQDAFCVDRFRYISNGNYTVNITAPNTVNNGDRAAWMVHNILPQINATLPGTTQRNMAAALQLAIWDVVQDGGDGFRAGRIQKSSQVANPTDSIILNLAKNYISQSIGQTYTGAQIINNVNVGALTQRLIVDMPGSGVPEPSTWAMALTGLTLAAFGARKRR
ncbi:MAG: Cys-Gln thioester bond-forming surface protein [Bryobacteraceae bacterium]|nr:Cys-Gln thioester bond-forming surface protein [Bryobacteraceae bacterium]